MVDARAYAFGAFLLVPERQLLMQGDSAVRIGGRALDILTALVERPGEVVGKNDLMARAWPTTTVDDANLKVNIAALRRLLGDDVGKTRYIATVTGRGYRFIAPVEAHAASGPQSAAGTQDLLSGVGYAVVIEGEITLRLGETAVLLKPGCVVARRGGTPPMPSFAGGPCRMLFFQADFRERDRD